ncbi:MAG: DUF6879 family protein [Pseudonocardiaceae bacterium]
MTLLPPYAPEFSAWFSQFERTCFRLETLAFYGGSGEDASLAAYLAGQYPPPDAERQDWTRLVRAATSRGRLMSRVHVVTEPLSDYLRFELAWSYPQSVTAGEDVRILLVAGDGWPAGIPRSDFWLFDDRELFNMVYASDGRWLGAEYVTDPAVVARACQARASALHVAQSWAEFVQVRPELRVSA